MVVSMLLERTFDLSGFLRAFYYIVAFFLIFGIIGTSDAPELTTGMYIYCAIQRTVLSLFDGIIEGFPQWLFIAGLIIEIILLIIVIIINSGDGPICLLQGFAFLYASWVISSVVSRLIYNLVSGIYTETIIILLVIFFFIIVVT